MVKKLDRKESKKREMTNNDLGRMIQALDSRFDLKTTNIDSKIDALGNRLDVRITKLESYMKEGFGILNNKIDHVDARLSNQIEGLGKRMDDLADNKVSRIFFKELESRVNALELKILPKTKK